MNGLALLATVLLAITPCAAEPDKPGSRDHPLLTRMQGMHIEAYRSNPFDRYAFKTGKGKGQETPVEGRFYEIRYKADATVTAPSPVAILRNHQQAIRSLGGTVVFEDNRYTILKAAKQGMETWVQVDTAWGKGYQLVIVEKGQMAQEVAANAEAFRAGLGGSGHVEVPGILFDTGKATLKPESAGAIQEVAGLLKSDPFLKVYIVGHTDTVAAVDLNLRLSQARAEAVVQALIKHGIAPARMKPHGAGPFAPVASNDHEEGRAKNRRVELVKE